MTRTLRIIRDRLWARCGTDVLANAALRLAEQP